VCTIFKSVIWSTGDGIRIFIPLLCVDKDQSFSLNMDSEDWSVHGPLDVDCGVGGAIRNEGKDVLGAVRSPVYF